MKKLFKVLAIVALGIFATSCANDLTDDLAVNAGGEVSVSFSAALPELASRAVSDGLSATDLTIAVYRASDKHFLFSQETTFTNRVATAELKLVQGMTYDVAFWAQSPDAPYSFDTATGLIAMNYSNVLGNNEDRDAFFHLEEALYVNGPSSKNIELYRPFAQVNLGTNDLDDAHTAGFVDGGLVATLEAYPTFNILTKQAEGTMETVAFAAEKAEQLVTAGEAWPGTGSYDWLSMNYILVNAERETIDVAYTITNQFGTSAIEVKEYNVPVQRNYRTNLVGSVLTNPIGLTIEIIPTYSEPDYGLTQQTDGSWIITSANGLKHFADIVNGTGSRANNSFKGEVVKLGCDLDLAGIEWTPIGHAAFYANNFAGTFDGQGYTIKNLNVSHKRNAGLFGTTCSATIKNLVIEEPIVKSNHYAGAVIGWIESGATRVVIENCRVIGGYITSAPEQLENGNWDNGDKVGAIAGFAHSADIKGCYAEGVTIKGYRDLGGILGYASGTTEVSGNEVKDIVIAVDNSHNYKNYTTADEHDAKPYVGEAASAATVDGNSGEATVTITAIDTVKTLAEQVAEADATIVVPAGEYELPTTFAEGVTLVCEPGTVFNRPADKEISLNVNGATIVGATFKGSNDSGVNLVRGTIDGSFKDCVFEGYNTLRYCYPKSGEEILFEDCRFSGYEYAVHFDSDSANLKFINCVFEGTFTIGASLEIYVEGCEFRSDLRKKFNIPNFYGKTTVVNSDFVFDGTATGKQSVRIHSATDDASKYVFSGCTVVGEPLTDHISYLTEKLEAGENITIDGKVYEYLGNNGWGVDGVYNVTTNEALLSVLGKSASEVTINLAAGSYELGAASVVPAKVLIKGADKDGCVVNLSKSLYLSGKSVDLENLTFAVPQGLIYNEHAFGFIHNPQHLGLKDCTINARLRVGGNAVVDNCVFNVDTSSGFDGYGLYYYGNSGTTKVVVKNSTFNTKGKAIVMYSESAKVYDLEVEGCTFVSDSTTDKAAIQMHTELGISGTLKITNSTATGFADVNGGLWNEVNNNTKVETDKFDIYVDGTQVH